MRAARARWLVALTIGCASEDSESPWGSTSPTTTFSTTAPSTTDEPDAASDDEAGSDVNTGESSSDTADEPDPEEDYADIARIAITPGFGDRGDGTWSMTETALDDVGLAFYAEHPDDYDFLVVYTEGDVVELGAYAYSVQYDTGGIGFDGRGPPWITPQDVGSAGRLLQMNFMNTTALYDPNDASIVLHETTHHWSAFIELPGTPTEAFLLDSIYGGHWNVHVHTGGPSATGYGDLVEVAPGRFLFTVQYPLQLSPLELYLAGMIPPSEVPPLFYVRDAFDYEPAVPPFGDAWVQGSYGVDAAYSGTRVDFTVDDVIAANGTRTPAFGQQRTDYRFAFILVCKDANACDPADLAVVEAQRTAFEVQMDTGTGGRATADASL